MKNQCSKLIVVLGMHRSGTSVITRALESLGVSLGDNLMPEAKDNNEKGFFEDLDIHALNIQVLSTLDHNWDSLKPIIPADLSSTEITYLHRNAVELLRSKISTSTTFAFKDPITSLILPFWKKVFSELGVDVFYLICIRNPLSVAASLNKRDDINSVRSQALWFQYQLAILQNTKDHLRLFVDYDNFIEDPHLQLKRIAEYLQLAMPASGSNAECEFFEEFLTPKLRHHTTNRDRLKDPSLTLAPTSQLYEVLLSACRVQSEKDLIDFDSVCHPIEKELNGFTLPLLALDECDFERINKNSSLETKIKTEQQLRNSIHKLNGDIAALKNECKAAWKAHADILYEKQKYEYLLKENTNSVSWRMTKPLRWLRSTMSRQGLLHLWRKAPLPKRYKYKLRHLILGIATRLRLIDKILPNRQHHSNNDDYSAEQPLLITEPIQAIPRLHTALSVAKPVKLIAFYLPQFHPIPENDQWWGAGFTEWTNVRPAQPYYEGHYQPHIPGDLGYYNLLDGKTQHRQVELAQQYGVEGFCFYFYWFSGKRLLETPIENYLADATLELPFCLCWANENWSRRWDGLEHDILIAQHYSPEDDLAFIEYVSRYMRDPRYIRIDGKPLLLVYRPSLLPDPQATAQRWRTWCRDHGIGDICLTYTHSFDQESPDFFGFDAAVEFPPNSTEPPQVTHKIEQIAPNFQGHIFDWSVYLKRSNLYQQRPYKLFRSVCPSWDNTARKREKAVSFINSSPRGYQQWLLAAIQDTLAHESQPEQRLVFINAWNEWAEGAHLEPDQRYGYGFLEATRMALVRADLQSTPTATTGDSLAVVIHAYYPDIFEEILGHLQQIEHLSLHLYVSCPATNRDTIQQLLHASRHPWHLEALENRGRDILPFLSLLPLIINNGHTQLIKVHTKKSLHREDGDQWRRDLYDKLLSASAIDSAQATFADNPSIGIIGPENHVVPMSFYWGSNADQVESLACRLGIPSTDVSALNFVAGTMFFAQVRALQPLANLALSRDDFEQELGQVDGTLAHAIERTISVSAHAVGMQVVSSNGAATTTHYTYADATPC